ncbi:hypothetical protein MAR_008544 [Mya arenaria]|uniref:Uncharacterized protein n=1 Tax=Mya arenaria TaxID=6604 RepID=A0ABY7DZ90_MYAAR|nr:hypothetical protein MAR_008544 [Mya arenaria]
MDLHSSGETMGHNRRYKHEVTASTPSSQKMFGKKVAHTSKNRVGRAPKDLSNGEDSNQALKLVRRDINGDESNDSSGMPSPAKKLSTDEKS